MRRKSYDKSVFINCPFDSRYQPLFRAAVFTVLRSGYYARSAIEEADASEIRLNKIVRIITECRYSIHDLSRTELDAGFPRFNMPFELGVFLGAKFFGADEHQKKGCLIFERKPFSYNRFISDIKGQDIDAHNNQPRIIVHKIRDWLATNSRGRALDGGAALWREYQRFGAWLPAKCRSARLRVHDLTFHDYVQLVYEWFERNGSHR